MNQNHCVQVLAVFVLVVWPCIAGAATPLIEGDSFDLNLGGYASSLVGVQQVPYETGGLVPEFSGLNAAVFRLEWTGNITEYASFEVHNRLYWSLTNAPIPGGGLVGLGSTVVPPRTFDLKTVIINEDGLYFEHDLDRLAVTAFTPVGDLTVGRQAVTWGVSSMFVVADLWSQFSPFELDTSQKRGTDAVRLISYPFGDVEMDLIIADRGSVEMLSFGGRWAWTMDISDQYFALAKSYRRVWAILGTALDVGYWRPYVELAAPYHLDNAQLELPRGTLGADYIRSKFTLTAEYHFNGPGADDSSKYANVFGSAEFGRGEFYFVGQHYAGLYAVFMPWQWLQMGLGGTMNLVDPSALLFPFVNYEIVQDMNLKFGGYLAVGEHPIIVPPAINSEYGTYGNLFFMELSAFF